LAHGEHDPPPAGAAAVGHGKEAAVKAIRWLVTAGLGLLAGLVASLALILVMAVGRTWLGISPPPEALPDRFAPTLDIDTFFGLFGRFGGYNGLKQFGIRSGLIGLAAVGILIGVAYALIVDGGTARPRGRWGLDRRGARFIAVAAVVLWAATLTVLSPVLDANYRGLPPSTARVATTVGLLISYALYGVVLIATYRFLRRPSTGDAAATPQAGAIGRRALVAGAAAAALAVPSYGLIRRLYDRATFDYDGLTNSGPGVVPVTPNDKFYTVTKNVVDPDVTTALWRLEVGGLVDEPRSYAFDDLAALPATDQETTLMCISNQIGSGLFSNAVWRGVPMRDLLAAAGPRDGAVEVLLHAADGYTDTFAFEKAMDPTTMVVYQMNGEPLPQRHGFPARVIVPGLFGEKNVKWVTRIEVVDHDAKGFYEQQGWGPNFATPTRSDIFGPQWRRSQGVDAFAEPFPIGETATIRGRAYAGDRGVARVEFSADDGETWHDARIDYQKAPLTWAFWSADWRPTEAGEFRLLSRATDQTGEPQPMDRRGIVPQGATGYHRVVAQVRDA
jgi:DMSO/TMAO reductase YedYZ molybdopterin-dependent catalytic subunit